MPVLQAIGSVLKGIWLALDGLSKVLHLILLLVLFGVLILAGQSELPYVPDQAALVLRVATAWYFAPVGGKRWTNTRGCVPPPLVSVELYAIHRPSGEKLEFM